MKEKSNKGDVLITLWIVFGVMIILGFFVFSMIIGGTAGNGYQEGDRYFVCEHSNTVEVSKMSWQISRIWGVLFSLFIPLTPIGAFVIYDILYKIEQRRKRF